MLPGNLITAQSGPAPGARSDGNCGSGSGIRTRDARLMRPGPFLLAIPHRVLKVVHI